MAVTWPLFLPEGVDADVVAGDSVVTIEKTDLRLADGQAVPLNAATLLVVEAVEGKSLLVKEEPDGKPGWVDAANVVGANEALEHFTARIKANPKDARAYEVRGDYYSWKMDLNLDLFGSKPVEDQARESTRFYWKEALADYDEAIRLGRRSADLFVNRASMRAMLTTEEEPVLADLDEAIRLEPDHAKARAYRGSLLVGQGAFGEALAELERAARLDPEDASTHCEIARIRGSCEDSAFLDGKLAVKHAERMLATAFVVSEDMHHVAAAAYARAGQFTKAIEHAEKGLEMTMEESLPEAQERLELYKAGKAYQDPKMADEKQ